MKSRILIAAAAVLAGACFIVASSAAQDNPDDIYWDNTIALAGGGLNGAVTAMTVYDGKLIVAGEFTTVGGIPANHIAAWDGSSWSALGTSVNGTIGAMTVFENKLVVAGAFSVAGGIAATNIAAWDGSNWSSMGEGISDALIGVLFDASVGSVVTYEASLVVGAQISTDIAIPRGGFGIFVWQEDHWGTLRRPSVAPWPYIWLSSLCVLDHKLVASTSFGMIFWDGNSWLSLESLGERHFDGISARVEGDGQEVVGVLRNDSNFVWSWNGLSWSDLGTAIGGQVSFLTFHMGKLIAGGWFQEAGGTEVNYVASWDGSTWSPLGSGMNHGVTGLAVFDSKLIAGGHFTSAGGKISPFLAVWSGRMDRRTWYVAVDGSDLTSDGSEDYPFSTIQHAVDSAQSQDIVLVGPGTYTDPGNRDIDFNGKDIVVMSENGPDVTIIDCEQQGRGFYLHSGETRAAVIKGFTITHGFVSGGSGTPGGAGILCVGASPTIEGNYIIENRASADGGGIYCRDAQPRIAGNVIARNTSHYCISIELTVHCYGNGGGVYLDHSDAKLFGNTVVYNDVALAFVQGSNGGGIGCSHSSPRIERSIVAFNYPLDMTWDDAAPRPLLLNCDLYHTGVPTGGSWTGPADQLGVNGNFSQDPNFCNAGAGNFHLFAYSPCAPANNYWDGSLIGALEVQCGNHVCGDANMDGQLTSADVELLQAYYFFQTPPDTYIPIGAIDMDCSGRISLNDLLLLAGYLYGYGPAPCCVEPPPPPPKRPDEHVLD